MKHLSQQQNTYITVALHKAGSFLLPSGSQVLSMMLVAVLVKITGPYNLPRESVAHTSAKHDAGGSASEITRLHNLPRKSVAHTGTEHNT